jgi:hypothetical protein
LKIKSGASIAALALIILPAIFHLNSMKDYYFEADNDQVLRKVYGFNPFPESKVIADKLNTLMKKEDRLAVMGTEIQMYVYTNKVSPSRFAGSGALLEFPVKQSKEWQQEFIRDVEKAAPRYLVFFNHPKTFSSPGLINIPVVNTGSSVMPICRKDLPIMFGNRN